MSRLEINWSMYRVLCTQLCYISWTHATHISRTAVCEMYFAGQVHRDAPRCVQPQNAEHHAGISLYLSSISISISLSIYSIILSLYIYFFSFKRYDNPHRHSELLASWRSNLGIFREFVPTLIGALGLVENLINVRRTRSVRTRPFPIFVWVATVFYTICLPAVCETLDLRFCYSTK